MSSDNYEYDVFISYRRIDPVRGWVHNHFFPLLKMWLQESFPPRRCPIVFIDQEIETGAQWADELRYALLRSRCLVCVWSPSYFGQDWCLAEWLSMRGREIMLQKRIDSRLRLVYPVKFNDGDSFPPDAQAAQYMDLSQFNSPHPNFKDTLPYIDFDRRMQEVARKIADMVLAAPAWEPDWPLVFAGSSGTLVSGSPPVPLLRF
jgi:hypothetical protein